MQIDWVTVLAQILNFLVLVWLLNKVLYRPVTRALADRAALVQHQLDEAEEKRAEAEAQSARLAAERAEIEARRTEMTEAMKAEVEEERKERLADLRDSIEHRRAEWQRQLEEEQAAFLARLRARAATSFAGLLRKALSDLADAELEERIAAVFLSRLEAISAETRGRLRESAARADAPPRIRSAFALSDALQRRLAGAVADVLDGAREPVFETDSELACGLVLEVGSQRLAWTIESYLDRLEAELSASAVAEAGAHGTGDETARDERAAIC